MKILLVDDDEDVLHSIRDYLTARGHQTETCLTVEQAMTSIRRFSPDLVITDIQMPETDGLVLLRQIRSEDADLPVILLTGHPTVDTAVRALRGRATDYLIKPVDLEDLSGRIHRISRG